MRTLLLLAFAVVGYAQPYNLGVQYVNTDPSPTCTIRSILVSNYANGKLWQCQGGTYVDIAGGGGGSGTVTSVALSTNLGTVTGSPVTTSGTLTNTVSAAQVVGLFSACSGVQYLGADGACHAYSPGTGTVTSVATGCGASGGTITATGTILGIGDCVTIANDSGTGTTTNKLVKLTGAPSKAIITGTGDTTGIIGVCDSGCGNTGSAVIQQSGLHITTVDGSGSTAGHWALPSTSIAGDTMDSGVASTSAPPAGSIGIYLQTFGGLSTVVTDLINNLATIASCPTCVTSASALTSNLPVIGAGSQAAAVGTVSGNTTQFVTTTGTQTSGDCVKIDANGNHIANGSACSGSSGATISLPYISYSGTLYCGVPLQACTAPVAADFAWSNQPTSSTETANGSALIVHTVPIGSIAWAVRSQDISPNTTLDTLFAVTMNLANFSRCGVGFLESGTSKMVTFTFEATGTIYEIMGTEAWSSFTGFTGGLTQVNAWGMSPNNIRVRLKYDGTNIYFYTSNDGVSWLEFYRASKTTSFTTAPNKWFYGCDSQNSATTGLAGDDYIELLHWLAF